MTMMQELLTLKELGERLKLSPETCRRLFLDGRIPGLKIGWRTLRFQYDAVIEALSKPLIKSNKKIAAVKEPTGSPARMSIKNWKQTRQNDNDEK